MTTVILITYRRKPVGHQVCSDVAQQCPLLASLYIHGESGVGAGRLNVGRISQCGCCVSNKLQTNTDL